MKNRSVICLLGILFFGFFSYNAAAETIYLAADFNDQPLDLPIGTDGPEFGQPVWVDPQITAIVRDYPMPTPCLEIQDNDDYAAGTVRFEFLGGVELTSGFVTMTMNLWFHEVSPGFSFRVGFREHGSSVYKFCDLDFTDWGAVYCYDHDTNIGQIGTYEVGRVYPVRVSFDMDAGIYSVWLDGILAVHDESHGVVSRGVGALLCSCLHDPDLDGLFNVDDILITDQEVVTTIPHDPYTPATTWLYPCYPNPSNPLTTIGFDLPATGVVHLSLFDPRGREVTSLVNGTLPPGHHEVVWSGCDGRGHAMPAGVYLYQLTNGNFVLTRSLLLVR